MSIIILNGDKSFEEQGSMVTRACAYRGKEDQWRYSRLGDFFEKRCGKNENEPWSSPGECVLQRDEL